MSSEREQFEIEMNKSCRSDITLHFENGRYANRDVQHMWYGWQAAIAAERKRCDERDKLFGRAMTVLKGLSMAVEWELAPAIMKEIDAICAEFEADANP